jgi:lipoic acid synthetase
MKGEFPPWLRRKLPEAKTFVSVKELLSGLSLHSICESALCPNLVDCFSKGTATFLILGNVCTRHCTFCAVKKGSPLPVDEKEPQHLLEAVEKLGLRHVVVTSVTRDDLCDGGASHFVHTIETLRESERELTIEVLIPDFGGSIEALGAVVAARPEVINHNVETIARLYPRLRPEADYSRSLELLFMVKRLNPELITKSGLMVGLGETEEEISEVMKDLREAGCDLLTIGQYLQPSPRHHQVLRFIPPEEFAQYGSMGKEMGFVEVASGPFVRSSYDAAALYAKAKEKATSCREGLLSKAAPMLPYAMPREG